MPYFARGEIPNRFSYKAEPNGWLRRKFHFRGRYLFPYFVGQSVSFKLWFRKSKNYSKENAHVNLYRNQPGVENQKSKYPLTDEWTSYTKRVDAPSNGAVEYRFRVTDEETSKIVVSVHGWETDGALFFVVGVITGWLIPVLLDLLFAVF